MMCILYVSIVMQRIGNSFGPAEIKRPDSAQMFKTNHYDSFMTLNSIYLNIPWMIIIMISSTERYNYAA